MASELTWKNIELHVENLIPGLILSGELLYLHGLSSEWNISDASFSEGAVFVAASYGLGVISAGISRFIVDGLSELGLRCAALALLAHGTRDQIRGDFETHGSEPERNKFQADLRHETTRWWRLIIPGSMPRAEWNAIYRAALRSVDRDGRVEVDRRRAQGRLTRNMFLPLLLLGVIATQCPGIHLHDWIIVLLSFMLAVLLYAYAEVNNFAEAYDIRADLGQRPPTPKD